jgi:phage terminase large subunit-like protein
LTLPDAPYRTIHGVDLAYTEKTRADWSVLLSGRLYQNGDVYLTNLLRQQVQADVFTPRMAAVIRQAPGPCLWYGNTTERGTSDLIRASIPMLQFKLATSDKYVRAMPTASKLWNPGKIHLPENSPWSHGFASRVSDFSGQPGGSDDDVDALAALGDLAIRFSAGYTGTELNQQIRRRVGGFLRLVQ